ncbi:MAG: hypothetical protein GX230_11440 [Lentisphaerae bacterium]|nr:hypothetical protein [Lentisphaerota bacterium]
MRPMTIYTGMVVFAAMAVTCMAQSPNWVAQLGNLAQDTTNVRETMKQVEPHDKQFFAERLLRAVKTIPLAQEDKSARFANVAHELVAGAQNIEEKQSTLSTIFSKADPRYLSGISDTLASGLEITKNGISEDAFLGIATNVIASVTDRTAGDPDALTRVTMATATFLRAAGARDSVKDAILASLGTSGFADQVREVVVAAANGNYEPMLAANEAAKALSPQWYVGRTSPPGEPLLHPVGSFYSFSRMTGVDGLSFGGVDAIPSAAQPYYGQNIKKKKPKMYLRPIPDENGRFQMVIR